MTHRAGKWSARDMTAIALMAVLMCLCTVWLKIPWFHLPMLCVTERV